MIDRRLASNFNWLYFLSILLVSVIGVVTIYSANHARPEEFFRGLYIKQVYWIGYGLIAMLVALALDYRWFSRYAYLIYALTIIGLGYVLLNGVVVSGSKRWIRIASVSIQVSEFAKIAIIIVLAKYFESGKLSGQYTRPCSANRFNRWVHCRTTGPRHDHDDSLHLSCIHCGYRNQSGDIDQAVYRRTCFSTCALVCS